MRVGDKIRCINNIHLPEGSSLKKDEIYTIIQINSGLIKLKEIFGFYLIKRFEPFRNKTNYIKRNSNIFPKGNV